MHTASILSLLMLYINGVDMRMFIFVADLVDLVLKKFVIIAFLIIHDTDY